MEERMAAIHDHIGALRAEAAAERAVHGTADRPAGEPSGHDRRRHAPSLRRRAGRALMALGTLVAGRAESEGADGAFAARG